MSNKTKKPLFASGLYIALSLCVLAVVAIGAYSAINELFRETAPAPLPSQDALIDLNNPTPKPEPTLPELPIAAPEQEAENTEDNEENESQTSTEPTLDARIYMSPVASQEILKEFKVEELVYSATMNDYRAHTGLDLKCAPGDAVCAFTDGVVESIHADPLMGQTIVLDHGGGLKSIYQNLSLQIPEGILAGIQVHAGDLIGAVGETAIIECAEDYHLHFEVMQDGEYVNPQSFLQ